jgi:hypothetical protein
MVFVDSLRTDRSREALKSRSQSEHDSARHSSGRNEKTRNSYVVHKLHRRLTDRRSLSNRSWLSKCGGSYLRQTEDAVT